MKLNKNVKLLLSSIFVWFVLSIILMLIVKNSKVMTILFSILSVILVLMIYRVLYLEFYYKYSKKYKNKIKNDNDNTP